MKAFQPTMDASEWGAFQIGTRDELATVLGLAVCDSGHSAPGIVLLDVEWGATTPEEEALENRLSNYQRYTRV